MKITGHRHTAIVVEDMDLVLGFYMKLGFQFERRDQEEGEFISHLIGHPKTRLESAKLRLNDGYRIELIKFIEPKSPAAQSQIDMARKGLHHLAFTVSNIRETITLVVANGGKQISTPMSTNPGLPSTHAYVLDCERNIIHLAENN